MKMPLAKIAGWIGRALVAALAQEALNRIARPSSRLPTPIEETDNG